MLLRLDGGAIALYAIRIGNWLLLLVLAHDLSALGYLAGMTFGAYCYKPIYTAILPAVLFGAG